MKLIERASYMDFLQRNRERPIIKVVSGVRRCGKSTLFSLYQHHLLQDGVTEEQIHVINFENLEFEDLQEYHALYRYVCERLVPGKWNYVFLDEIQHVPQFEKAVDSLFIKEKVDIYITGSNAYFMSSDLATLLSGRYVELRMLPLSFREFCSREMLQERFSLRELYEKYTRESSFPYAMQLDGREKDINEYMQGIYSTILLKDIVARLRIADAKMLESVTKYLFLHVGSLLSPKKIADSMTSAGRKIDAKTVDCRTDFSSIKLIALTLSARKCCASIQNTMWSTLPCAFSSSAGRGRIRGMYWKISSIWSFCGVVIASTSVLCRAAKSTS